MNKNLLHTGVQNFINENLNTDIVSVLLKSPQFKGITQKELGQQLLGKQKAKSKLPTWFKEPDILYPPKLNLEQTSSEYTAKYKSKLVDGNRLLDVTGGFGIDSYFFAQHVPHVFHTELDPELAALAKHNFYVLGANNIHSTVIDGLQFLKQQSTAMDWVYIDPSRRDNVKGKVFLLQDCLPNVPEHLNVILEKTVAVLVKTSPLLDITNGLRELQFVKAIHIVAVKNEVKELLWVLERDFNGIPTLICANILDDKTVETFSFLQEEEQQHQAEIGAPFNYLYEPNAALLKAGAFKTIGHRFKLMKLHEHSHLYTSNCLLSDFPGRSFKIIQHAPYSKKSAKQLGLTKANVTTRNFPETVAQLRKKHKIKDGGNLYVFFTTNFKNERIILICEKL
ncbi:class I SAM-dependent methyltransferase [Flavobacterium sp. ASW18X]|nr:class I SAM-dependent methyltransferase [Flavobacterium sp. ASW18X]TKD59135.1 class I SAM-dependent methyltransferase [Flavobacterium sp. ASW18X]